MNLPTTSQVNAATRHVASFAAGAIAMFGLSNKIDPATVTAIINSTGTLVSDLVVLIGLVTPMVAAWMASRSASLPAQAASLEKSGAIVVGTPELAAATPNSPNVLSNTEAKVVLK